MLMSCSFSTNEQLIKYLLYNDAKVLIQSSFRCECVGWKSSLDKADTVLILICTDASPADMICPLSYPLLPPLTTRKTISLPPSICPTPPHDIKTDYLSALYMQHGSKPKETLSPAALYSHDDTWGKGKGGAVRRKKYIETGDNSNKTVEKWAQKQQRVAVVAGCRMSGIGRWGAVVPRAIWGGISHGEGHTRQISSSTPQ